MNATPEQKMFIPHDEVASLAWQIWQQEGCLPGRERENWLTAGQLLLVIKHDGPKHPEKKRMTSSEAARPGLSAAVPPNPKARNLR